MGWLYKLVCIVSGKAYVGQTGKLLLAKRMDGHRTAHRRPGRGCRLLNNAIRKHGWHSFRLEVLGRVPKERLDSEEARLIALHGTLQRNGYNLLEGATVVPMHCAVVRAKRARTMEAEGPRRAISEGVKRARKDRPDWLANQVAARRARAEREREAKMAGMTEVQKDRYLKERAWAASAAARRRRTSC
jgi:group I intron endonuclease